MSYYPDKEDEKNISLPATYLGRKITDLSFHQRTNDSYFNISHQSSVNSHQLNFSVVLRVPYFKKSWMFQ